MKNLSYQNSHSINGGNWVRDVDIICAVSGVLSLQWTMQAAGAAFCAGWGLGRVVFQ